jgi:16S rRNA (guanine966-N2)-methyltransferase
VTRIIAGAAGGLHIAVPRGRQTRPTSGMAREGLFATVTAVLGSLAGAAVADLYAGSGAVGLEALSRGATDVLLVEADAAAIKVIRQNIAAVGLPGATAVHDRVERMLRRGRGPARQRDLVFADPPYRAADGEVAAMLESLSGGGWLAPGGVVVVERRTSSGPPPWPPEYVADRSRRYGETTLWYGRAAGHATASAASTTGA